MNNSANVIPSSPIIAPYSVAPSGWTLPRRIADVFQQTTGRYFDAAAAVLAVMGISFLTRFALSIRAVPVLDANPWHWLQMFLLGCVFDLTVAAWFALPLTLYLAFVPQRLLATRWHGRLLQAGMLALFCALLFGAVAEWLFWGEFETRFNFIAVDYLVYTTEVANNIRESFPLPAIFAGILTGAIILFRGYQWLSRWQRHASGAGHNDSRWVAGVLLTLPALIGTIGLSNDRLPAFGGNNYFRELSRNGVYSLFAAFRNNELAYLDFYPTLPNDDAVGQMKQLMQAPDATFVPGDSLGLTRAITATASAKRYNVIQITVESLSAAYLGVFGNREGLTPNLDALADASLLCTHFYATGTRTDRGMEALTLSVPPTPGRSIVKRPHNEHLFTVGSIFRRHGYDTTFLYGGYGYFDNMNDFFGGNGYKIVDRAAVAAAAVTFANAWGACDEDVYSWALAEADRSYAEQRPFFHFIMTTSNHRPFTYPDGRIDIPSGASRRGAVKYTDYAIGKFIAEARTKPWFDKTIFVIVADHCASSAGKTDLPIKKYEIPLLIYCPAALPPQRIDTVCSQIDFAPTLLAVLGWSYQSRFYGKNILAMTPADGRALIGTYQALGYMRDDCLVVLRPGAKTECYRLARDTGEAQRCADDPERIRQAIAYYQTASLQYRNHEYAEIPDQ